MEEISPEKIREDFITLSKNADELKLKIIDNYKNWLTESINKAQKLTRFFVLVSLGIMGVIIPMIGNSEIVDSPAVKILLIITSILFFIVIVHGFGLLIYVVKKELYQLPRKLKKSLAWWDDILEKVHKVIENPTQENVAEYIKLHSEKLKDVDERTNEDEYKIAWSDYVFYGLFFQSLLLFTITLIISWYS